MYVSWNGNTNITNIKVSVQLWKIKLGATINSKTQARLKSQLTEFGDIADTHLIDELENMEESNTVDINSHTPPLPFLYASHIYDESIATTANNTDAQSGLDTIQHSKLNNQIRVKNCNQHQYQQYHDQQRHHHVAVAGLFLFQIIFISLKNKINK